MLLLGAREAGCVKDIMTLFFFVVGGGSRIRRTELGWDFDIDGGKDAWTSNELF